MILTGGAILLNRSNHLGGTRDEAGYGGVHVKDDTLIVSDHGRATMAAVGLLAVILAVALVVILVIILKSLKKHPVSDEPPSKSTTVASQMTDRAKSSPHPRIRLKICQHARKAVRASGAGSQG